LACGSSPDSPVFTQLSKLLNSTKMAFNFDKDTLKAAFDEAAGQVGKADSLNLVEFGDMLIKLVGSDKLTSPQVQEMFNGVKGDDDEITFDEMWSAITAKPATKDQLEAYFKAADSDGSGSLTKDEVTALFQKLANPPSQEAIDKALSEVDTNDDGKVNYAEFLAMMD